jgi:hypothetical protein
MNEGDELLGMIRQAVSQYPLPVQQQEMVTEIVGRTVIAVMSNPRFLNRLLIVQQLQHENVALRQHLMQLQAFLRQHGTPVKAPPRKKAAKKAPAKKKPVARSPQVRVKGSTPGNRRAFKQGYRGS